MPEYWGFKLPILLVSILVSSTIIMAEDVPPLIRVKQSFQAEIEATFVTDQFTMDIKEYFQAGIAKFPERGSILQTVNKKDVKIVFDYSADKLFVVADGQCDFKNISVYLDDIFAGKIDPLAKYPVLAAKDFMRLLQDAQRTHINDSIVIRGIKTSLWRFKLTIGKADLTVDSYFTRGWHSESGNNDDIPVRFDVYGTINGEKIQVIFDYYFFEYRGMFWFNEDVDAFEMPSTIFCKGANVSAKTPELPDTYSYTAEIVNIGLNSVEVSKVWYDDNNKLLRQDSHPTNYPLSGYPVSEIYDLQSRVVYKIDNILQNCSVESIEQDEIDNRIIFDPTKKGNKINLQLTDTLAYLRNENNKFTYLDRRKRRDIVCDVYMSQHNMTLPDGNTASTIFVYYFMSDDWRIYPDIGGPKQVLANVPIMFELFIGDEKGSEMTLDKIYNYIDFSSDVTSDMFSIPQCYSRNTEIYFRIGFPGDYFPSLESQMHKKLISLIADSTAVLDHRVQRLSIQADQSFIYVRAAITDRTKPEAQFTRIRNKKLQAKDVKATFQKSNLHSCATKCLSAEFSCSGFDLSNDDVCRLTMSIIANISRQLPENTDSTFYLRTIIGSKIPETSVATAWKSLTRNIYHGDFIMSFFNPSMNETIKYTARTVELLFGQIDVEGNPIFPPQMSYRAEFTVPVMQQVNFHATWYDSERKLFRLDEHFFEPKAPFYSVNPLTTISDFNDGISYHIDQGLGNCTILPLADDPVDATEQKKDNTIILRMKDPDQLFKMDSKVKFYGQKTVRGILCDVYEATREDFIIPGVNTPKESVFRYCFVNGKWADRSDNGATEIVGYTPLQLEIMSSAVNYYAVYNFFDYSNDIPPTETFDIRSCFEKRDEYQFQITFSGAPIDTARYVPEEFIQKATRKIAAVAQVNILRIQEAVLEYDPKYIYLTATLLTYPPAKAHFRKFAGKVMNRKEDKTIANVKSIDECADKCMKENQFTCNSFEFCPDGSKTVSCKLSKLYSPDGKNLSTAKVCDHYSRVVSGGKRPVEPLIAIGTLKDAVDGGNLNITVNMSPDSPNTAQTYIAIKLRDDVTTTDNSVLTAENNIKKFDRLKNDTSIIASERMHYYPQMSVDDCANICLIEATYKCESFAFCFTQGDCYVSSSHPDQKPQMLETHTGCSVYNRNYLYRYDKEPGVSTVTIGDKPADATSESDCAKLCTINDDFLCQSFEYCPELNECTLSKIHKMDIPDTEISGNVECDIYFRKYVDDFTMSKGKRVALVNNQILTDLSEEQCAKACMEEESFNCASFDYCANTTECRLTNHDTLHSGKVTVESSAFCNHFRPISNSHEQCKPDTYPTNLPLKNKNISKANLTAVALSTLFVSFLLGTLFMTFYIRRKSTVTM